MRRSLLLLAAVSLLSSSALAKEPKDARPPTQPAWAKDFEQAAKAFVARIAKANPKVRCELKRANAEDLHWARSGKTKSPAKRLIIWAPSGANRAYGLLPRYGTHQPVSVEKDLEARVVAIGPDLLVVEVRGPPVALTLEAMEKARPLLEQATAPIAAWRKGEVVPNAKLPAKLRKATRVVRYPHCLEIALETPEQELDLEAVWSMGVDAVYSYVRRGGHRVVVRAKPKLGSRNNPILCWKPRGEHAYLRGLKCPLGQPYDYKRRGSVGGKCPDLKNHKSPFGSEFILLDAYELKCRGGKHEQVLYFDMYHEGK